MGSLWLDEPTPDSMLAPLAAPLWKYALLFAAIFIGGALLIGGALEYFSLEFSSLGNVLIFTAASIVCIQFARTRKRLFHAGEAKRLMLYSLLALLCVEAVVLLGTSELRAKLSGGMVWFTIFFTVALNAVCVWIGYRFVGRSMMVWKLKKLGIDAA